MEYNFEYKTVIISPCSRKLRGKDGPNPKDYPYWEELVRLLGEFFHVIQIGSGSEFKIPGVTEYVFDRKLRDVEDLVLGCDVWIGVDNFLQHMAHYIKKPGVVIFGQSDPHIFGYPENLNILKDTKYLREKQFDTWEAAEYREDAFLSAEEVLKVVNGSSLLNSARRGATHEMRPKQNK